MPRHGQITSSLSYFFVLPSSLFEEGRLRSNDKLLSLVLSLVPCCFSSFSCISNTVFNFDLNLIRSLSSILILSSRPINAIFASPNLFLRFSVVNLYMNYMKYPMAIAAKVAKPYWFNISTTDSGSAISLS